MNYINNPLEMCCALGDSDTIRVERRTVLVDTVSNKVCELGGAVLDHTYSCEERWALVKSYAIIAYYPTEAAARAAYDDLVAEIAENNNVFAVSEG